MEYHGIQRYLQEVLATSVRIRPWDDAQQLPFYLRNAYDFAEVALFDTPCLLVIADRPLDIEADIRRHLDVVAKHAPQDVLPVYVTTALASYERKRLIAQGVPFIVPGNQLFLPPLGMDLREYFRERPDNTSNALSPATQALLFTALLRPWKDEIHPERLNERFGYTPMTVSRATRELQAAGLARTFAVGREKWLRFDQRPEAVWQRAQSWLRSPVRRSVWAVHAVDPINDAPLAGLSALAAQSALADSAYPERAMSSERWKHAQHKGLLLLHAPEPGATRWQIWRYDPSHLADHGLVDPLSLIVSLREDTDDRVQQAAEQLEAKLPW
ncbi:hypothetical protein [Lysobacter sp. Root690]|uniref:hypothetical protein n=1 Tax=Lysobacter sp. Root690 TaxID=1736588 RepID=UPI0006FC2C9B|nr:hypothetical protein [Lysobacter sp. Root690]KRB11148.1 hypothetical protein ASD86_01525 [Lysobacter sp. Root690]